jgi:hypothetical protein
MEDRIMASLTSLLTPASDGASGVVTKQPKVFFNGTLTAADLTGNDTWTLFTNDATTTSVIESVTIDETVGPFDASGVTATASFINDTIDIGKTVNLAGTEIAAPSTSLTIKLDTPFTPNNAKNYSGGVSEVMVVSSTLIAAKTNSESLSLTGGSYGSSLTNAELIVKYFDATYDGVSVQTDGAFSVPSMAGPRWYYSIGDRAYYFYCDGNSTTELLHATITNGTVATWGSASSSSYSYLALDLGSGKAYRANGGRIYERDLATNTETTIKSSGALTTSSYSTAGAANGVFFYVPSSSYTSQFNYYDTNTSEYGYFSVPANFYLSSNSHLGVCYNPDENKFYLSVGFNTSSYIYSVDWASKSAVYLGRESTVYPDGITSTYVMLGNNSGEMFIKSSSGELQVIKFENDTATVTETVASIGGYFTPYNAGAWYRAGMGTQQTANLAIEDHAINLKCKVSGTEYKEG